MRSLLLCSHEHASGPGGRDARSAWSARRGQAGSRTNRPATRRRGHMSEPEELEIVEVGDGLTRRDVFVKGGLLAAGATLLGGPVAAASAAVERGPKSMKVAVITHGAGDTFWAVAHKGASAAGGDLGITVQYSE